MLRVTTEAATPQDVVLHFSVRDTGVGIPLDRQESIFEAFTQADGSSTRTLWRHRTWPDHLLTASAADGRAPLGRE